MNDDCIIDAYGCFIGINGARDEPDPRFWKPGFGGVTKINTALNI